MPRPAFPPGETEFVTIRVMRNEDGVVRLKDSEIVEYLRNTSGEVRSILSCLPRGTGEHRLFKPQVAQTFEAVLTIFEIEAPAVAASRALEMRRVLSGDPHGLRLSYVHPTSLCVRWLDVEQSIALTRPETGAFRPPIPLGAGAGPDSGPIVAVDPPSAIDTQIEDDRETLPALTASMTALGGRIDALTAVLAARVSEVEALKAELQSLGRRLAQVQCDLAGRSHAAEPPSVDDAGIDDWIKLVDGYVEHFRAAIKCLSSGPEQQQLETMAEGYKAQLHVVRTAGKSPPLSDDAVAMMKSTSSVSLRDQTIAFVDLVGKLGRSEEEGAFEAALAKLEELIGLEPIAPKPGERVDPSVHEFEPQGVPSEHPRGTVTRVLRRGYRYDGRLFRPARVEMSKGRPEGAGG